MGSPLVVELAEIRVADVENTALTTYKDPPNTYRHFVDDGIGDFRDKSHADGFLNYLNSLTDDLQYTIEYPSHDGSLPYMDILNPHTRRQIHICLQKKWKDYGRQLKSIILSYNDVQRMYYYLISYNCSIKLS